MNTMMHTPTSKLVMSSSPGPLVTKGSVFSVPGDADGRTESWIQAPSASAVVPTQTRRLRSGLGIEHKHAVLPTAPTRWYALTEEITRTSILPYPAVHGVTISRYAGLVIDQ